MIEELGRKGLQIQRYKGLGDECLLPHERAGRARRLGQVRDSARHSEACVQPVEIRRDPAPMVSMVSSDKARSDGRDTVAKLFLSHSTDDDAIVRDLRQALADFGQDVWIDSRELRGGDALRPELQRAIEQAPGPARWELPHGTR